ncbi:Multidrug resistance protein MdtL [Paraburkholderia domus]|jgi:Arabinose efflux permease|uniref:Multidrug resistance protein MdtL n=1 Tax=Paraburkholderia domus TaxID=2793075 RepID=A0A9N8QUC4_9BURK|nr:MFS transporter [Paraburkholderia domus]MBK5049236.1 MFS transporter [Burkholderia sp. R-70006]MBK5060205.1 MFS transporter [Burkholderia sp. R-70199]MBK5085163.1 MFS transporter [Burkholderia sp. R-69927]MBK5118469.1 MFS transporter [Burkholderia sp. R-69980]MBK5164307.1 MFS transporter [Burkholderia sp. R-70211]MBK5179656.1 MFS transporter [Burkholderia sp. R-69749]
MAVNMQDTVCKDDARPQAIRGYACVIFALTFGLLLSDYMSRQVLSAVFPQIKAEWGLSDTRLGALSGIVSLAVGILAFPISLAADRWGRVRSVTIMAAIWSIATLLCGLSHNYFTLLSARFLVGVGEAAYASVGMAILISMFPARHTSTVAGAFMAGSMVGSVMGIGFGGSLASHFGWRSAFVGMAVFGIALTVLYMIVASPARIERAKAQASGIGQTDSLATVRVRQVFKDLFSSRVLICVYIGSGLQLFINGGLLAWLPSFLNRVYDMPLSKAGGVAAIFVLCGACGMPLCGALSDRLGRDSPRRKMLLAITFNLTCTALLFAAFQFPAGSAQLALIALALFFSAGVMGPAGTMVANLTPKAIHSTAMATLALAFNILGLAPGAFVTGVLADRLGLAPALRLLPLVSVASAVVLLIGVRHLRGERSRGANS